MHRLFRIVFLNRSLTFKIALATIAPVLIAWILSVVLALETLQRSVHQNFHAQSYELAAHVAHSLADPDHFHSKNFLTGSIQLLKEVPDVVHAMILDSDNRYILIHSDPELNGQPFDLSLTQHEDTLNVSSPVIINGVQVGLVIVGVSTKDLVDDFQQYLFTLFGIAAVVLLAGLLLAFLLAKILSTPVRQMAIHAKHIGEGSFDEQISYSGHDALGELTSSFNTMSAELDRTLTALHEERAGLQQTVNEKTAELQGSLKQLHDTNLHLKEAIRTRSRFFTSMSHELRTPLNGILGTAGLLHQQHFGPLNEKQQGYVKQIDESGNHLLSLVNDLLDIAKIDADSM
ncbi:MAG: HAMP domain-containing protein [Desulfobulbaceae bacterium]|nr:HAMP domain-containing protein [Desulfobulbaceae bacterium]